MPSALVTHRLTLWISMFALVLSACSAPAPTPAAPQPTTPPAGAAPTTAAPALSGSPIKVGVLDDVTGIGAIEGALMRISVDLVVQQTNASGGINGHPLQVIYADPKGDATQAMQSVTQMAEQGDVDALACGSLRPDCLACQGLAYKLQMVYVAVNVCASDLFSTKSCSKYSFRVYPAGRQTSDPAFTYLVKTFGNKWGIIYPDYA